MSVMLLCTCGNDFTIPDEAALGMVACPVCHGKVDPKKAVIHPRLDDLDPSLLLADDDPLANPTNEPTPSSATSPNGSTKADDDFLSMMNIEPLAEESPDEFSILSSEPEQVHVEGPPAATEPSSVESATPIVIQPSDDDEGYAVVEAELSAPDLGHASSLPDIPSDLTDELDELELASDPKAKPGRGPSLTDLSPLDELLGDDILVATEAKPLAPLSPSKCPECETPLRAGAVLCVACGYNVKLGKKVEMDAASAKMRAAKGKAAGEDAGSTIHVASGSSVNAKSKLKDPRLLIVAAGVVVALLVGVGGFFLFGGKKEPPPAPVATPAIPSLSPTTTTTSTSLPVDQAPIASSAGAALPPVVSSPDSSSSVLLSALTGINGRVASFAASNDGKLLAGGDENGNVTIWDMEKNEAKPSLQTGASGPVNVSFNADGSQLLTGYMGGAKLWDVAKNKERSFKADGLWGAKFSTDGESLLLSGPSTLWSEINLAIGGKTRATKGELPAGSYAVVDFTADGKTAVLGSEGGLLEVWDLEKEEPSKSLEGHTTRIGAVAISPDGKWILSAAGGPEYRVSGNERLLASSRPTDFTMRLWNVESGREVYRLPMPSSSPVTCLAFSGDGKQALIVAGEVQVFDVAARQLVTTLAPTPPGSQPPPTGAAPPTEPFSRAAFLPDGRRLVTNTQTSGVHIWELPLKPAAKPLAGIADPTDLAAVKLTEWASIPPLMLSAATPDKDSELANRLAISAKAAEVSATKNKTIKAMKSKLASTPRTAENLLKLARACQKAKLDLEADECLRACLMADPTNEEAKKLYEEMKMVGRDNGGPVSITRAWIKPAMELDDAGTKPEAPRNTTLVSVPIDITVGDKQISIDQTTLVGKAGEKEAEFQGIHRRPEGEVVGVKKGVAPPPVPTQIWEAMQIAKDTKTGKVLVQLHNRKTPQNEQAQPRGQRAASIASTKIRVREEYRGPYEAVFAVPEGETLSTIQWEETAPIRVLAEEPTSLDNLVLDIRASKPQRLAAIEALGVSPTSTAVETLEQVIASGDDELFQPARTAMRGVRRRANMIAPEYLPVPDASHTHLEAIVLGKVDGQSMPQPVAQRYNDSGSSQTPAVSNYSYCKTLWKLDEPGKYLGRVAMFGPGPDYPKQTVLEFQFDAANPNLYVVQLKTDRDIMPEAQLVELWRDDKLLERRILSANSWSASALAAKLPLETPGKQPAMSEDDSSRQGNGFGSPIGGGSPTEAQIFSGTPIEVTATPIFGATAKTLPPVERASLETLLSLMPAGEQSKLPVALIDVARLEMGDAGLTKQSLASLRGMLGDSATPLFIRLAQETAPPTALAAIYSLHTLGEKSADACRTLIDLQKGPADVQKAAQEAVENLMSQGVIAQEGSNWRYHNQTHFPEQEAAKTAAAPVGL